MHCDHLLVMLLMGDVLNGGRWFFCCFIVQCPAELCDSPWTEDGGRRAEDSREAEGLHSSAPWIPAGGDIKLLYLLVISSRPESTAFFLQKVTDGRGRRTDDG